MHQPPHTRHHDPTRLHLAQLHCWARWVYVVSYAGARLNWSRNRPCPMAPRWRWNCTPPQTPSLSDSAR